MMQRMSMLGMKGKEMGNGIVIITVIIVSHSVILIIMENGTTM